MTLTERFDALPEPVQRQLIRIARQAAGMSAEEKQAGRIYLATVAFSAVSQLPDEGVPAANMVGACGQIVAAFDEAAGPEASGLVV